MSDVALARRLLLSLGPTRFIVFGQLPDSVRHALRDAGGEVHASDDALGALRDAKWMAGLPACASLVCLGLSGDALTAVLSEPRLRAAAAVYIQHQAGEDFAGLEALERRCFEIGYRKHPAYYRVFGYQELEESSSEIATLLEPLPFRAAERFPLSGLGAERDLHMDMLREAGRRSDGHVVRYDWASKFVRPGDVVLDAACGLGYGTYVMRHLSDGARFYGIDGSDWAIDYARTAFSTGDTEFIAGFLPDALRCFEDASVDLVVSFETLEHVASPKALLAEFQRVLRPGGRVVVSVPNDWSDETGKDPNPHHLHVYTWDRLTAELGASFELEHAVRQIASGCKRLDAHCQWVPRPRTLQTVDPAQAPRIESEWWLAVAMKPAESGRALPYRETVHPRFEGSTHLVDFGEHYQNPWLVHAMVEIPFRLQRTDALKALAARVGAKAPRDSADYGAALAVTSYRALEEHKGEAVLLQLEQEIADYLAIASTNPHTRRWQVSLRYVRARLRLRRGDTNGSLADFAGVADADVASITPTLGTKVVDAAFWAGKLVWLAGDKDAARRRWKAGLAMAGRLLASDWKEFFGNADAPFVFAMNDAVEIVDRATACAQALLVTGRREDANAAMLHAIGQLSLRSALRERNADLVAAREATVALRSDFDRVCRELEALGRQNGELERTALERLDQRLALEDRIQQTDRALDEAAALSKERLKENLLLHGKVAELDAALQRAEQFSLQHLDKVHALEARLVATDAALDETKGVSLQRLARIHELEHRLRETDAALDAVKELSVDRLRHSMALEERIDRTEAVLDELKLVSIERLKRIELLEQELAARDPLPSEQLRGPRDPERL